MRTLSARVVMARRFVMMLGGEVAQSLFHFGLNIALVRALSPHDYGRFAILFLIGGLGLTYVRALAGIPAGLVVPSCEGRPAVRGYEVSFGSGAVALSLGMALAVAVTLRLATDIDPLAGGCFIGAWALRSYLRGALYARRRAAASGLGDLVFALSGTALAALVLHTQGFDAHLPILDGSLAALACANALGVAASLWATRQPVRVSFGRATRRRYRALMPTLSWSLVSVTAANLQGQGQSLLVALMAGPAAYAPIAATFVLLAPLRLVTAALLNMVQPEIAADLARGGAGRARRFALLATLLIALGSTAYGAALLAALPLIETHLFAGRFAQEPMTLITVAAWGVATTAMVYAPGRLLLETRQAFRALAALSAASAVVGGTVAAGLLLVAAPAWSLAGLLLAELLVLAYCAAALRTAPAAARALAPSAGPALGAA